MLVRFNKARRLRAAWLLALVYMLCVLAPGVSFAFSDGSRAAPCLTDENHAFGIVHVHEVKAPAQHVHADGHTHEHPGSHAASGLSAGNDETPVPASGHHKAPGAQCCGMVCLSALPATIFEIVTPSMPMLAYVSETYRNVADNAPPRLYRPPIS